MHGRERTENGVLASPDAKPETQALRKGLESNVDKFRIGLRTQDFSDGYRDVSVYTPRDVHLHNTILVGKAASLAVHLRGLGYINDYQQLLMMAAELGINSIELPSVLRELEEIEFVRIVRRGAAIHRIEIGVPELRAGYEELADRWNDLGPSEIERATIDVVDRVITVPQLADELIDQFGLSADDFAVVSDLAANGNLIQMIDTVDGKMVYSPLAIEEDPRPMIELVKRFEADKIGQAFAQVREEQGLYVDDSQLKSDQVLSEVVQAGVLAPVEVTAGTDRRMFVFTPRGGLKPEDKVVLDKARAILACVRYGQHFAKGTKIRMPSRLLRVLQSRGSLDYHPFARDQYGVLVTKGIGFVEEGKTPTGLTGFQFHLHETPDNKKALQMAIELLETGEAPSTTVDLDAREILASPGSYVTPIRARARVAREGSTSPAVRRTIIDEMSKIARGMFDA